MNYGIYGISISIIGLLYRRRFVGSSGATSPAHIHGYADMPFLIA
jgi:hypothetical protein